MGVMVVRDYLHLTLTRLKLKDTSCTESGLGQQDIKVRQELKFLAAAGPRTVRS